MKKKALILLLVVCFALAAFGCSASPSASPAASGQTASDTSWDYIKERGKFIVGLDDNFPPMGFRDTETNEITGFDIELAKAVAKEMGLEVEFHPVATWGTVTTELDRKDFDVIWNGFSVTDERKEKVDFSDPYMKNQQVVVVLESSSYQTLADLNGKKASIQGGSSAIEALDKNAEFKSSLTEVIEFNDNNKAIMDLERGSVDCLIVDSSLFSYYNKAKAGTFRVLNETLGEEDFAIGFRKGDDAFRAELQKALDKVSASDEGKQIAEKWFGSDILVKK